MNLLQETDTLLREKLSVPQGYHIAMVSSATECWEIVAQSLVQSRSAHFYNGAFGQKWHQYAMPLGKQGQTAITWALNDAPPLIAPHLVANDDVWCITHNETSNGTQVSQEWLQQTLVNEGVIRVVDATSSLGGVFLDFTLADVWFASVQKCLGLPAGMALLIYSDKALQKAHAVGNSHHYNSLLFIQENFAKHQTHYTPNVLGIYLLNRVMQQVSNIEQIDQQTTERAKSWYSFFEENGSPYFKPLVQNTEVRSATVIAIEGESVAIEKLKKHAENQGITLGNGYGTWKENTVRIANFPAIEEPEIKQLKEVFMRY